MEDEARGAACVGPRSWVVAGPGLGSCRPKRWVTVLGPGSAKKRRTLAVRDWSLLHAGAGRASSDPDHLFESYVAFGERRGLDHARAVVMDVRKG